MLEGVAMSDTLYNVTKQNQLQLVSGSKKIEFARKFFMWLDPRQTEILQSNQKKQYIIGPASTGKTLLVQLKVLELFETNIESKVLIILPYKHLVQTYEKFFQESGLEIKNLNLLITTLSGEWRTFTDAHTFIDEYCAIGPKENLFAKNHQDLKFKVERMPDNLFCWITMDFWQGYETISDTSNYIILKDPKVTALTMFHRCTIGVLKEYSKNYNEVLMEVGHQHVGQSCETVLLHPITDEDSLNAWVNTIKEIIEKQNRIGWKNDQIAIIHVRPSISDSNFNIVKLRKNLEAKQLSSKFEFETLSQEWPVVIICLPNSKKENLSIAQSRAIAKIIYVQPTLDTKETTASILLISNTVANLSLSTTHLKTKMEVFAYHQEMHRNNKLTEEMTYFAFVEEIKQKLSMAHEHSYNFTAESLFWAFSAGLILVSCISYFAVKGGFCIGLHKYPKLGRQIKSRLYPGK